MLALSAGEMNFTAVSPANMAAAKQVLIFDMSNTSFIHTIREARSSERKVLEKSLDNYAGKIYNNQARE